MSEAERLRAGIEHVLVHGFLGSSTREFLEQLVKEGRPDGPGEAHRPEA